MQLGGPISNLREATTLADGLRQATAARGHKPALTVLGAGPLRERRDEQAFASLHQWVAKGAHLLEVDAQLEPGDLLHLDAPAGWMAASVCLAAWWIGAGVTDQASMAKVAVVHESRHLGSLDGWVIGEAVDGSPSARHPAEAWSTAVQSFPDHPPPALATPDALALVTGEERFSQADLLRLARALPSGRLGVRDPLDLMALVVHLAARPAATADPVILIVDGSNAAVQAEQIAAWA